MSSIQVEGDLISAKPSLGALPDTDLGLPGKRAEQRVVVAMSGGVDSTVVAGLLAHAGYEVVGITLQLYDHGSALPRKGACCAGADVLDAKRSAARLGIAHYVLDYESRFSEKVINPFADSYIRGETPIPCVACNQTVKFEDLLGMARELGAAALATGHYVESLAKEGHQQLYRAKDESRDQSYFLFATTQAQLDFLRFPLGGMPKSRVRELAEILDIPVAHKPDSQDICFVPDGKYADLIRKLRPEASLPGPIVHVNGDLLGEHEGLIGFTVGQRRGLGVATGDPLFVVRLEPEHRRLIVGPREALQVFDLSLRDINWLGEGTFSEASDQEQTVWARVRSTRPPVEARLGKKADGSPQVSLIGGEEGVAPGQACVFYEDSSSRARVLGGGWIVAG